MKHAFFEPLPARTPQSISTAGAFSIGARTINILCQLATFLVMARLLSPSDFGLVAMALPFVAVLLVVGDLGLSNWTLQAQGVSAEQASALFWISGAAGLGLAIVVGVVSPAIGWFYGDPRVTPILAALAIQFVFAGFYGQHRALLQRSLNFRALAKVEIAASLISTASAVGLVFLTRSYWALVLRFLLQQGIFCAGVWIVAKWTPARPTLGKDISKLVQFGFSIIGFSLLNTTGRQVDSVLIGWRWGSSALGPYSFATRVFLLPVQQLLQPLAEVMIPVLSGLKDQPEEYRRYFVSVVAAVGCIAVPLFVTVAVFAEDVVYTVAGEAWSDASPILSVFSLLGGLYVFFSPIGWLMISHGRAGRYFRWALLFVPIYVLSYVAGLPWGPLGVACGYACANLLILLPSWYYGVRGTPLRISDVAKAAAFPGALGLTAAVMAVAVSRGVSDMESSARLISAAAVVICVWLAGLLIVLSRASARAVGYEIALAILPSSLLTRCRE